MPIIQIPFRPVEVAYDEAHSPKYQRVSFLTLSDLSPTIGLDVDFRAHEDDIYDELCVGLIVASAETYGHLPVFDLTVSPQCIVTFCSYSLFCSTVTPLSHLWGTGLSRASTK